VPTYYRAWQPGGTYFFTVNLHPRDGNDLLLRHIALLCQVVRDVRNRIPFVIHARVVLPEHLHCILELTDGDQDIGVRWRLIKMYFSNGLVARVGDWPYSTFHRLVEEGVYPADWAGGFEDNNVVPRTGAHCIDSCKYRSG
jgi:putative transposase